MGPEDAHRLAALDEQRLVVGQPAQLANDRVERRPAARRPAGAPVDHQGVRVLGDLRIEVVHQHPQDGFLLPAATRDLRATRCADRSRAGQGMTGRRAHGGESTPRVDRVGYARRAMQVLAVRRWADLPDSERARLLARSTAAIFDPVLMASIESIFREVRERGDAAVVEATRRFDGVDLAPGRLAVAAAEIAAAHRATPKPLLAGIREAIANSRRFNEAQLAATGQDWQREVRPGFLLGERFAPIPSAGLFVPTGKASYPSVLCQIGTPAVVAGVPDIVVVVPPVPGSPDGAVDPATLAVARELGIERVFRANGPAAIAALTFGTETIPSVVKVVGPGHRRSPPRRSSPSASARRPRCCAARRRAC